MHIINTWTELDAYLSGPIPTDLKDLLATRRDQLQEYGDLSDLGVFAIIQPGDTIDSISEAVGWPILMEGIPTFEWVQRHSGSARHGSVGWARAGHWVPFDLWVSTGPLPTLRVPPDRPFSNPARN